MQENETNEYYQIRESVLEIRGLTALHSKEMFPKYAAGILLIYFFMDVVPGVLGVFFPRSYFDMTSLPETMIAQMPSLPYSVLIYSIFMTGVFTLCRSLYCLYYLRNRQIDYNMTFEGFGNYLRATILYLIQTMLISFGLMAFIAPGVILFYSYRQAFYLMAEDPSYGPVRCLRESRYRMRGNRMQLFRLDVSYVLNLLAAYLPQYVAAYFLPADLPAFAGIPISILLSLPVYLVTANMFLGQTVFYELLREHGFRNFRYAGEEIFRESAGK